MAKSCLFRWRCFWPVAEAALRRASIAARSGLTGHVSGTRTPTRTCPPFFSAAVDDHGRLVPASLCDVRGGLDEQLLKMSRFGPTETPDKFPTEADALAYWYNARAAWSIKLADLAGCQRRCPLAARKRAFPLDGREMSLERIDAIILDIARRNGDFRLAACSPGAWADHAPLPRKPFDAADFKDALHPSATSQPQTSASRGDKNADRLTTEFNRLAMDEKRFVIDVERRRVCIPPMLWSCRDMVISSYRRRFGPCDVKLTTAIRAHLEGAARYRLENAMGYSCAGCQSDVELNVPGRKRFYPGRIGRVER